MLNKHYSPSSNHGRMKHGLLDSARRAASDNGIFMSLAPIYTELLSRVSKTLNMNNFSSAEAKDIKIPPLNAPYYDESNKI